MYFRYAVLLESLEPVPGVNPEKILKLIESGSQASDASTDYRDVKIVSLAKKCRALNLSLMKEKSLLDKKSLELDDSRKECETLKKEIVRLICTISSNLDTK